MTALTIIIAIIIGTVASLAGGALGGMIIGRKDLGPKLAAMMGAFYGTLGGLPGIIVGLALIGIGAQITFGTV